MKRYVLSPQNMVCCFYPKKERSFAVMKCILALFLSAMLAVGLFAIPGFAAEPEEIPDPAPSGFTEPEEPEEPGDSELPEEPERPEIQPQDAMPGDNQLA